MWIFRLYQKTLTRYPILIQSIQTGLLIGISDFLAQCVIEKRRKDTYNLRRTAEFMFMGTCFLGPTLVIWHRILENRFPENDPRNTKISRGFKKTAVDQIFFAPIGLVTFMSLINIIQMKSWDDIKKELDAKYYQILTNNYKVWPAVQILNFTVVPLRYQVLLSQGVAVMWNTYLSWKTQQKLQLDKITDNDNNNKLFIDEN